MQLEYYIQKGGKKLRLGYTTGSCAAAAAKAAALMLLGGEDIDTVLLQTPKGICLQLELEDVSRDQNSVTCYVRKDAGDDPDVTHGMRIGAAVSKTQQGLAVDGGQGVGRVTRPGLLCPVGEAAINPAPKRQILAAMEQVCAETGYTGGLLAVVTAENGEDIAEKTFNPHLGIAGGISILGTSGIVEPMSERALVATIQADIDARRANGEKHLLLIPGNYGQEFVRNLPGFSSDKAVRCSNYIGEAIDHAAYCGFERVTMAGHMGKLIKLAGGIMNTHSRVADGRMEIMAAHCALSGMDAEFVRQIMDCVTVDAADALLCERGFQDKVWDSVARRMAYYLSRRGGDGMKIDFIGFLSRGIVVEGTT